MSKILAIDDISDNLILIESILSILIPESRVFMAQSGQEGIDKAQKETPDVILLDITMPGMDGYEVCRRLKQAPPTSMIPVIMITANQTDLKSRIRGLEIGADAFLTKPINESELVAQVRAMLRIKEAEDKLRAEKEKLEEIVAERTREISQNLNFMSTLLNTIPNPIFYKNFDGVFMGCNNAFLQFMNLSQEEVIGKTAYDFAPRELADMYRHRNEEIIAKGETECHEAKVRDGKGDLREILFYKAVFKSHDNKPGGLVGVMLDITERTETEKELAYERDLLQALMDNIPDTIYYKDRQCRFTRINKAQARLLGVENPEDAIGHTDFDFFNKEHAKAAYNDEQKVLTTGAPLIGKAEKLTDGSGKQCWLSATKIALRNENNEITGLVGISRDISQLKEVEHNLETAKKKAEESDRLKTSFLSNLSHEIRTPMNAILGFSNLIAKPGTPEEKRKEFVKHIHTAGENLLRVITDIIDISKLQTDQVIIKKTECNIKQILLDLYTTFDNERKKLNKKQIELQLAPGSKEKDQIMLTDRFRLRQILANILDNALKFTEKGFIEFGYRLQTSNKEPQILFFVKDSGIGIAPEHHHLIFKRFGKIENENAKLYGGTGLGLSIAKQLVELMNGTIWVESQHQQGATFYFALPFEQPQKTQQNTPLFDFEKEFNWQNKTILIAEDEFINFVFLKEALIPTKVNILHATDGRETLQKFKESPVDLVLLDIKMPDIDGYQANDLIHEIDPKVPVIAQTAYALSGEKKKIMKSGFNDYISKPISQDKLLYLLKKYLN